MHLKQDSRLEAASSYVDAAKCYQKTSKTGMSAVNLEVFTGRLTLSAALCLPMQNFNAMQMSCGHSTMLWSTTQRLAAWAWQQSS